ncbi:MAG TPA: cytochrome c [Gaiellaceae bacterium]|nr:cytochrome c [Gaiellaceae bacterium]
MLLGLTTDQKLGLAGTAAVFIGFALVTALLIPRYRPDFPGRKGIGLFIVVTLLLTVAMLGAVVVFAAEDEGAEAAGHVETELTDTETGPTETETGPAETETGQTETTRTATTTEEEAQAGDPAAGKALFASNGCAGCHTFEAAGSTGAVGPNLDEALEGKDAEFVHQSIVEPNAEVAEGYNAGVMPSFQQLSEDQVNDLVAFLTQS